MDFNNLNEVILNHKELVSVGIGVGAGTIHAVRDRLYGGRSHFIPAAMIIGSGYAIYGKENLVPFRDTITGASIAFGSYTVAYFTVRKIIG